MRFDEFHAAALALPGAALDIKWGEDRIFVVGGKMFAGAGSVGDPSPSYSFKASPMAFEHLVEQGLAIPAPYLARASWVRLNGPDVLADDELRAYLAQAHAIVVAGLSVKARKALGIG